MTQDAPAQKVYQLGCKKYRKEIMRQGLAQVVDGNQILKLKVDQFNELLRKSGEVERELAIEAERNRILKRFKEAGVTDETVKEIVRGN